MFTATLRGMLAHKLRLLLTTASIALGIALLSGTLMLTDTMNAAFRDLFGGVSSGTDAVVRQEAAYAAVSGTGTSRDPVPASVLEQVRAVDGVAVAEGTVSGYALMLDTDGKAVLTSGGAPTAGYSMTADAALRGDVQVRSGRAPAGPGEVAIDARSASEHDIAVGADISILFRGPSDTFTVVGTVGYGDQDDLGGSTSAYFDTQTAQRMLGAPGSFSSIVTRSDGSLSDDAFAERIATVLPAGTEAVTGTAVGKESSDAFEAQFAILGTIFTALAGIALFVGSFIIWNTFTMIVTQRSREIALLRAVGATRRQVLRNLLGEAALIGVGASALGIAIGAGVAKGLNALMDVLGFSVPSTSLQVLPRTVVLSLVVGTVVTVLAAVVPARRATKVLPVEALRAAAPGTSTPSRLRAALGGAAAVLGAAAVGAGLVGDAAIAVVGLGLLAVLVGVITLAPLGARPLARVIGAPLRRRGVAGLLARDNAMRNPRRTASTATALMIGLALVVGMGVVASSLKASFAPMLENSTNADLFVAGASLQTNGFSPDAARKVVAVPGVATASSLGWGMARFDGVDAPFNAVDPATVEQVIDLELTSGSVTGLGADGVLVPAEVAAEHGWSLGAPIAVEFPATGDTVLQLRGTYEGTGFLDGYLIGIAAQEANEPARLDTSVLVGLDEGADLAQVKGDIAAALAAQPDARVLTPKQFAAEGAGIVDQLLTFLTVMLLLAVVIALLGIVNTLALSVHERTRELGLLRAVGMTTRQVRAMVRWESVLISVIGGVAGAALGVGLGAALTQALKGTMITTLAVSVPQIGVYLLVAVGAGVLAAVGPARSASRVDVLQAVVTD
jgi:putative ABC transport system permease protein